MSDSRNPQPTPGIRILVVEDSAIQAETLRRTLAAAGYSAVVTKDGAEGLSKAKELKPDLVITDILMPEMNGFELCRHIKDDPDIGSTPVILLTSLSDPVDVISGLECGADNFIVKPYDEHHLLSRIKHIHLNRELQETERTQMGVEIYFGGKKYFITSEKKQILDLLISTYENAVQKNSELIKAHEELKMLNEHLEQKVKERTATLTEEIEERKKAEEALRQSNERFDIAVKGTNDGIWDWEIETKTNYFSPRFCELLDYGPDELAPKLAIFESLLHPDDRKWVFERVRQHIEERVPYSVEYRLRTKNGEYRWFHARGQAVWDESGKPFRMAGSITDITERKKSEDLIKNILESVDEGFIIIDRDFRIMNVNRAFSEQTKLPIEDIIGRYCYEVSHNSDKPCYEKGEDCSVKHVFETKGSHESIHKHIDSKGGSTYLQIKASPFSVDKSGKVSSVMETLIDITERKLYEESLLKTTEELKKLDEMKSNFISVASHELRTPMTSIKNAVDLILTRKAGEITEVQEKFLSMAQRNVNRLSSLINDLLDISKIESGKMKYQYAQIGIREIIGRVINTLQPLADKKSISLKQNIAPELPVIYGDVNKIEQMLLNLIGNAIKFTPEQGAVTIESHEREGAPDMPEEAMGYVEISVADTGIGIPEEHKEHLFEKFYQATHSLSRQDQSGTGLGLAISKDICEAHGGKIWLESKEGEGSTFHFTLPIIDVEKQLYVTLKNELSKAKQQHLPLSVLILRIRDFESIKKVLYEEKDNEKVMEMVKEKIISGGIKTTDKIGVSLHRNEIMLIMPDTDRAGVQIVQKKVMQYIIGSGDAIKDGDSLIASVATYPEDGASAEELVDFAREKIESKNNQF